MTGVQPLIDIRDLVKTYGGSSPLRIREFQVSATDRIALAGLDRPLAELVVHLITGAAVPDQGTVLIAGTDTRSIATDKEWLGSLDRFGLVSDRAVLLDSLPVASNMALPLTLAIEPMSGETRTVVEALARDVGLAAGALDVPMSSLGALDRVRVHLARALANAPEVLLLEEPTAALQDADARAMFGRTLARASEVRAVGWLAFTSDQAFIRQSGGTPLALDPETGTVYRRRRWWPWGGKSRGA